MKKLASKIKNKYGFSLIELALALVVVSSMSVVAITKYTTERQGALQKQTFFDLRQVKVALENYVAANGIYPCPSDPALAEDDVLFSVGQRNGATGNCTISGGVEGVEFVGADDRNRFIDGDLNYITLGAVFDGNDDLLIGGIPCKDIGLPANCMFDPNGNRYAYAVIRELTRINACSRYAMTSNMAPSPAEGTDYEQLKRLGIIAAFDTGESVVQNFRDYPVSDTPNADYALVYFGPDGYGAYNNSGSTKVEPTFITGSDPELPSSYIGDNAYQEVNHGLHTGHDEYFLSPEANLGSGIAFGDVVLYGSNDTLAETYCVSCNDLCDAHLAADRVVTKYQYDECTVGGGMFSTDPLIGCGCLEDTDCEGGYECDSGVCVTAGEPCTLDGDCASNNCVAGYCEACSADNECESNNCVAGVCTACADDVDCESGFCDAGVCSACVDGGDCDSGYCNSGVCTACVSDANCVGSPLGSTCDVGSGVCGAECSVGSECPSGYCVSGSCESCSSDSQCESNNCVAGNCVACSGHSDCESNLCVSGVCTDCSSDTDCASNNCVAGVCTPCASDGDCESNLCVSSVCTDCTDGEDCVGNTGYCVTGTCTPCVADANCAGFSGGQYCNEGMGICGTECNVNSDCSAPGGCHSGVCNNVCTGNADCLSNNCTASTCIVDSSIADGDVCDADIDCVNGNCTNGVCISDGTVANGGTCDGNEDCLSNTCTTNVCVGKILGAVCGANGECASNTCTTGNCTSTNVANGSYCNANGQCLSGLCTSNACDGRDNGASCSSDAQCDSNICYSYDEMCIAVNTIGNGSSCDSNNECESNTCTSNICVGTAGSVANGGWCNAHGQCLSNICTSNACVGITTGDACSSDGQCATGNCTNNECIANSSLANGETCDNAIDCVSGTCTSLVCVGSNLGIGEWCNANGQCTSGNCSSNLCAAALLSNGSACTTGTECLSGTCTSNFCTGTNVGDGGYCNAENQCASEYCCNSNTCEACEISSRLVDFDGVNEYASALSTTYGAQTKTDGKAMAVWFSIDALLTSDAAMHFFGVAGETPVATNALMSVGIRRRSADFTGNRLDVYFRPTNGSTGAVIYGSTELASNKNYFAVFQTNGSATQMWLGRDGYIAQETTNALFTADTGGWMGNISPTSTKISLIGATFGSSGVANYWNGKLDEIIFFNDDLTSEEITALYNNGVPVDPRDIGLSSKITSYYMNGEGGENGSITTFYDKVGSDNLTSYNMENADIQTTQYPGQFNSYKRVDFDGTDERAYTTTMPSQMSAHSGSISFWMEPDAVLSAQGTISLIGLGGTTSTAPHGNSFGVRLRRHANYPDSTATYVEMQLIENGGAATSNVHVAAGVTTKITAGNKFFVVITSDGSANKIFVNGTQQTLGNYGWTAATGQWWGDNTIGGTKRLAIGSIFANNAYASNYLNGKLDEIALWNTALNQTQVTELYNSGRPFSPLESSVSANLTNYWKMGEDMGTSITTIYDSVGSSNFTAENMESADIVTVTYP